MSTVDSMLRKFVQLSLKKVFLLKKGTSGQTLQAILSPLENLLVSRVFLKIVDQNKYTYKITNYCFLLPSGKPTCQRKDSF